MEGGNHLSSYTLKNIAEPLLKFGEILGMEREFWVRRETLEQIAYNDSEFSRDKIESLTLDKIIPLLEIYGDALKCSFRFAANELEINSFLNEETLNQFRRKVQASPTLEFTFNLNKRKFVENLQQNQRLQNFQTEDYSCKTFLYLFHEALESFLKRTLVQLEVELWEKEKARKVIFLVPSYEILLAGPYLSILGGEQSNKWQEILDQEMPNIEHIQNMYNKCREHLNWQGIELQYLTPLHFHTKSKVVVGNAIPKLVWNHLAKLIVLYTADRTIIRTNERWVATYAGAKRSIDLELVDLAELSKDEMSQGVEILFRIVNWAYDFHSVYDRLPLMQISIIEALQIAEKLEAYKLLIRKAKYIESEVQWQWKIFAEGKIQDYVEQIRTFEEYITKLVQAFADQVSSIINRLTETMFGAVAVFLASAALFRNNANLKIFELGMCTYAVYILIFPLTYNMSYQWLRYQALCRNFNFRYNQFKEHLYSEKVEKILGLQVEDSKKNFVVWFGLTIAIYILVVVLAFWAAVNAPGFIVNLATPVTPASPTPTLVSPPSLQSPAPIIPKLKTPAPKIVVPQQGTQRKTP